MVAQSSGLAEPRLLSRRGRGRPPLLAVPRGRLRQPRSHAGLVHARALRMNAMTLPAYAEFAVQSNFSFLRGASKPEELAVTAKMLGLSALGLADRNTVAGVVRAWQQSKEARIAYHPGCRLVFSDGTPDILAYPQDRQGWGHLCRMLTEANERGEKGDPD